MFTTLLVLTVFACSPAGQVKDSGIKPPAIDETTARLDRMISTSERMLENLKKMNHNSEMIFRAVTGCPTDQQCAALKEHIQEQIEEGGEK